MPAKQPNQKSGKPDDSAPAEVDEHPGRELTDEQQARKSRLLSRFRIFAKESRVIPDYAEQPHDEMCDELEARRPDIGIGQAQKKELYLAPRYTYKTSLLICYMIYLILWFKEYGIDIAIDYVRAQSGLAEDVLYELKMTLQTNPIILELWGDLSVGANIWAQKKINLSTSRDSTITTAGLDFGGAGKHPDVVICDDIVNEKNFDSIKAKRAARVKVQAYFPILPPWGSMIVSGTRFAHNDVYGWILDQNLKDRREYARLRDEGKFEEAEKNRPQWDEYIRSVRDKSGNLFFPGKLTEAFLAQQKRSVEAKFYAAWYENRPDVEGMVRFRLEYLRYFSALYAHYPIPTLTLMRESADGRDYPIQSFPVRVTMTIDPTLTANATSDRVGITVNATDAQDQWWVLLAHSYLEVPSVIAEKAIEIIRRYRPAVCRIESANADVGMVARIQRVISAERLPTVLASYSVQQDEHGGSVGRPSRRKKHARIEALEPRFRNGDISLHRNTCEALYDQYRNWPDVDYDDVFDALAMQYGLAKKCQYKTLEEAQVEQLDLDDDEPGDIWSEYRTSGVQERVVGRVGISSQRLNVG
jgi:hypothetical protein